MISVAQGKTEFFLRTAKVAGGCTQDMFSVSGSNAELVGSTINYLCNNADASSAVPVKNLQVQYLTMTSFAANTWTVICVFILPLFFIVVGGVIWFRRRKG